MGMNFRIAGILPTKEIADEVMNIAKCALVARRVREISQDYQQRE